MDFKNFIDSLSFKTFDKVMPRIHEKFPSISKASVRNYLKQKPKDYIPKNNDKYMNKTFENYRNGYMADIFINKKGFSPPYFLLFIGVNTRYVVMFPMNRKDAKTVRDTMEPFINKFHPVSLTTDNDGCFVDKNTLDYLTKNHVELKVITEENHNGLSILNRFCKTLRDMNDSSIFTNDLIQKYVKEYNNTFHSSIKMTPKSMLSNGNAEESYIINQILKQNDIENQNGYNISEGSFVRYLLQKPKFGKIRHKISPDYYIVSHREGNAYVIEAKDGSSLTLPRYKLIPVKNTNNIRFAPTIEGSVRGVVKKLLSYNKRSNKYKVLFEVPNADDYQDEIPASYLRGNRPQTMSNIEKEFFKKHKSK